MIHFMKLKTMYLNLVRDGVKTIELRLFDEKRRLIKVGDIIEFSDVCNDGNIIKTEVKKIYKARDFTDLCSIIQYNKAGFSSNDALIKTLEEFYPLIKQQQYGVVGIEIKLI